MSNRFKRTASRKPKGVWEKPVVQQLQAGSAEVGTGTVDDGDPGTSLNNS